MGTSSGNAPALGVDADSAWWKKRQPKAHLLFDSGGSGLNRANRRRLRATGAHPRKLAEPLPPPPDEVQRNICRDCGYVLCDPDPRSVGACYSCHAKNPRCWVCGKHGHQPGELACPRSLACWDDSGMAGFHGW